VGTAHRAGADPRDPGNSSPLLVVGRMGPGKSPLPGAHACSDHRVASSRCRNRPRRKRTTAVNR
jgi:hypothetical protein